MTYYQGFCIAYQDTIRHAPWDFWEADIWGPYDLRNGLVDFVFYTSLSGDYALHVLDTKGANFSSSSLLLSSLELSDTKVYEP